MRQRWGTLESDPGRHTRIQERASVQTNGDRSAAAERIRREFHAGEIAIDCIAKGCQGIYVTAVRELQTSPGSGSRVTLRCTRDVEEHDVSIQMRPYEDWEVEQLKAAAANNEPIACPRCNFLMQEEVATSRAGAGGGKRSSHQCQWCGVRWLNQRTDGRLGR